MEQLNTYIIHTDGGSRGNPGPAASGLVITLPDNTLILEHGEYIGEKTNNEAEYRAVIIALEKLKELLKDKAMEAIVRFHCDSELLVKQMNGQYKISNANIKIFAGQIRILKQDFKEVTFKHIYREHNKEADRMVNLAIDTHLGKRLK